MQNVAQGTTSDNQKHHEKASSVHHDIGKTSTPQSSISSPTKSENETFSELQPRFMTDSSESEEDSVSEVECFAIDQAELEEDNHPENSKFLLSPEDPERSVDPETQARLEALLQAAGIGKLSSGDGKHLADHEVLRRLTSSVSCALDEAAAALTRMRSDNPRSQNEKRSLVEACTDGDVGTVKKLLTEGRSVHETTEEGESLLSLACSAGYYELAQVLLAMSANVEDRGIKGDCTPLMEAASAGHADIVRLLIAHGADVNAQSTSGNTPLMYACAGGHEEVVRALLEAGANVEDHNENGHTPLMEAASAGHVPVAKILLEHGAGINTHSNEFKESALTLACYKGHLDMVRFLLEAGADQEHKTDEMHTALMEASMDGHVEVARLLLDSGAQVNMPTDSFESPLTLAACGGHVDLAMLLIERGANIEEVNDEGYTPLMEAAREGHEEMVALLLSQGALINTQTEETQETALTLACCGGFLEVADFLIKAGADIELGASTPLMEAAQEGHLDLVRYLLESGADVHAQTQTGDTALTYACENGHTDVADLLLQFGADLEHESEGGRTPLMKACRAGHLCTVQFLISKRADVDRQTTNNDHTPLSLACAGGHLAVVELLLAQSANPFHKLKDNSTMLIEAAKGGHTNVVQLLLDYPHSIMMSTPHCATSAPMMLPQPQQQQPQQLQPQQQQQQQPQHQNVTHQQHVPHQQTPSTQQQQHQQQQQATEQTQTQNIQPKHNTQKSLLRKNRSVTMMPDMSLTSAEAQQVRTQPAGESIAPTKDDTNILDKGSGGFASLSEPNISLSPAPISTTLSTTSECRKTTTCTRQEQILHKQQILEELQVQRVERELQMKGAGHLFLSPSGTATDSITSLQPQQQQQQPESADSKTLLTSTLNIDLPAQSNAATHAGASGLFTTPEGSRHLACYYEGYINGMEMAKERLVKDSMQDGQQQLSLAPSNPETFPTSNTFATSPPMSLTTVPVTSVEASTTPSTSSTTTLSPPSISTPLTVTSVSQPITASSDVSQNTAISDRPKAKPVSKKEGKNIRKVGTALSAKLQQQQANLMAGLQQQYHQKQRQHSYQVQQVHQLQQLNQKLQLQLDQVQAMDQPDHMIDMVQQQQQQQQGGVGGVSGGGILMPNQLMAHLHPTHTHYLLGQQPLQETLVGEHMDPEIARLHREGTCPFFNAAHKAKSLGVDENIFKLEDSTQIPIEEAVDIFRTISMDDGLSGTEDPGKLESKKLEISGKGQQQQAGQVVQQASSLQAPREYFALPVPSVPTVIPTVSAASLPLPSLQVTTAGVQIQADMSAGLQIKSTQSLPRTLINAFEAGLNCGMQACINEENLQSQLLLQSQLTFPTQTLPAVSGAAGIAEFTIQHSPPANGALQSTVCNTNQVQVATQTQTPATTATSTAAGPDRKQVYTAPATSKGKKARYPLLSQQQATATAQQQTPNFPAQNYQLDPAAVAGQYTTGVPTVGGYASNQVPPVPFSCIDVDSETDSNHDTALTLACAGGHEDLVELLLSRGADIEHRDKKGFTPLILAATAGHQKVVEILLNHGAEIEAQSERTKDTPLSLACSGGRYEVVELLLNRAANKEHRNVSDYTPLSLAASGGYVNIIKLLLSHGAEINSRTGSKLGISPLMLAAMNGHTAAVKLLLDMGSDINAQIETNRNTALTLACFQGRHEVVSLLLDRKANVEHRAKTGLTPLMEAASGGYVEVGRVLLNKGADVNATPVPSSRDTALTIAADKGHCRFVELLLSKGTQVEVKNKKGNSPLWLAANGGHLNVVDLLYHAGADIDSQDNRKVSCLMAAFRKGHIKVVKWMVSHVTQFPSDQEMTRYIATVNDKELLEKCHECVKIIRAAKETQAAKANKNATILLEELDMEKTREESKKAAAARRRERKKKKKLEKKEEKRKLHEENKKNETIFEDKDDNEKKSGDEDGDRGEDSDHEEADNSERMDNVPSPVNRSPEDPDKEEGDSGIDANSQGSCSSNDVKAREKKKEKKKKKSSSPSVNEKDVSPHRLPKAVLSTSSNLSQTTISPSKSQSINTEKRNTSSSSSGMTGSSSSISNIRAPVVSAVGSHERKMKIQMVFESSRHPADREDFEATGNETYVPGKGKKVFNNQFDGDTLNTSIKSNNSASPKQGGKREEGWKEVVRKGQSDDSGRFMNSPHRSKKVSVPPHAISRVIGRGGSNINAIRGATGAHIEVEKQSKSQGERIITIKGSVEATKQAHTLIAALIKDPDVDILQMLPKSKLPIVTSATWDKTIPTVAASKVKVGGTVNKPSLASSASSAQVNKGYTSGVTSVSQLLPLRSASTIKLSGAFPTPLPRATAPRLVAAAEKRAQAVAAAQMSSSSSSSSSNTKTTMSYTSAIMTAGRATKIVTTSTTQTFAAKLSEITASIHTSTTVMQSAHSTGSKQKSSQACTVTVMSSTAPATPQTSPHQTVTNMSPKHCRPLPTLSAPPTMPSHYSGKTGYVSNSSGVQSSGSVVVNGSDNPSISTSATSMRVTPSPPATSLSQVTQQQQQQHQMRSSTPVASMQDQQPQQQSNTPLEYSLFNDTFTKVTQQSMWGGREESQKGMNFATVAGGGVSVNTSGASPKFMETAPPQVDASKAPGYRGTAMCSPVSSKSSSTNSIPGNTINNGVSPSGGPNPIQPPHIQSSINYNEHPMPNKAPGSLAVARPVMQQQSMEMGSTMTQFNRPVFQSDMNSRNAAPQHQQHVMPSSSQPGLDVGMFKGNNTGYEHPNVNSSLLKMVPNEGQPGHTLLPFHPHMPNFSQAIASSATVNTTVSMSRLNPRAPDFSSSLHLNNKPQVTMFNAGSGIHPNMYATVPAQPPSGIQSNNLTMLSNFPLGKYQTPSRGNPNTNLSSNGQTRWPFAPPHNNYPPHQDPMMGQISFSNHLANMSGQPGNIDLITSLENGGSPAMSPSSPAQVAQDMSQMKIEDRKVPRPIGTERAWKNYNTGMGPGGDADPINWMLNEKLVSSWAGMNPAIERNQIFRSNTSYNRISNVDADLHQIMESTFQGHLDNQQQFPNGNAAALSMMPGLTILPGQFGAPNLTEIQSNETGKMEPPAWGMPDTMQDKQHPGWNKWTH